MVNFDNLDIDALRRKRGVKWNRDADDILPAWVADMDFPVASPISEALIQVIETQDLGYSAAPEKHPLRRVFRNRLAERFGWEIPLRRIALLTDVVQGLYVGLSLYSEPGQRVVVQTPIYRPFMSAVSNTHRRFLYNPLLHDGERFVMDLDRLADEIDAQTRIILLCNPHNPTGRAFERAELEALAELVLAHDLTVISDEIHAELVYDGRQHIPFGSLSPAIAERTVTLMSASKTFNIAGLHCALAIFGSDSLLERFETIPVAARGAVGSLGLTASLCAFKFGQPWLDAVISYLQSNRDWLAGFLQAEIPAIQFTPPEATYLAWLDCRELKLRIPPHRHFLEKAKVALSPGPDFGAADEASNVDGFVRLNFATSRDILERIVERMAKSL